MKKLVIAVLALVPMLGACANTQQPVAPHSAPSVADISAGRTVAIMRCSRCHGVDGLSRTPNPSAPAISDLLTRYTPNMLADDLIDGIRIGHGDMPEFSLPESEASALVAYLDSLR